MENKIKVSVICLAYNHEKYIKEALEGFVMQKTDFLFEVFVHDDASTDNTAEIIREYEKKYPGIIKAIYQTENQYSKGVRILQNFIFPILSGEYIALCEGDDYWTDPYKLQKQYDAMEKHKDVDICAHAVKILTNGVFRESAPVNKDTILSAGQVIEGDGGYVGTNTLMYRRSLMEKSEPKFRKILPMDYTLQIYGSLRGGMLFLYDTMSVYRANLPGSWTESNRNDKGRYIWHCKTVVDMLECLNEETLYRYESYINNVKYTYNERLFYLTKKFTYISHDKKFWNSSIKAKIYVILKCYAPAFLDFLLRIKNRIRNP